MKSHIYNDIRNSRTFRTARKIVLPLYLAILMVVLLFLVVLNNSELILYSFIAFAFIGIVLSRDYRNAGMALVSSTIIISVSSIFYYSVNATRGSLILQNIGIVGYYLLISSIIALLIRLAHDSTAPKLGSLFDPLRKFWKKSNSVVVPALGFLGIAILLLPIWPLGMHIHTSLMPYIPVIIYQISHTYNSSQYILNLDLSKYPTLINPQRSNMLLYIDGNVTDVSVIGSAPKLYNMTLLISTKAKISNRTNMRLYITSYSTGFNNYTKTIQHYDSAASSRIYALAGNLTNVGKNITITERYYGLATVDRVSYANFSTVPYYELNNVCLPGTSHHVSINYSAISPESLFIFRNDSAMADTVLADTYQKNYGYYVGRFANNSLAHVINSTSGTISAPYTGTCLDYAFVLQNGQTTTVRISSEYTVNTTMIWNATVPAAIASQKEYFYGDYGFLPSGLSYLYEYYMGYHNIYSSN